MKYKIGDFVKFDTGFNRQLGIEYFVIIKCFPNFRNKKLKGYSISVADEKSIFFGKRWASVKEDNITLFLH